jgi:hypothetical protein
MQGFEARLLLASLEAPMKLHPKLWVSKAEPKLARSAKAKLVKTLQSLQLQ